MDNTIVFQGFLHKLAGEKRASLTSHSRFRERWVIIRWVNNEPVLDYYDKKPKHLHDDSKGQIKLGSSFLVEKRAQVHRRSHCIEVTTLNKKALLSPDDPKLLHRLCFLLQAQARLRDIFEEECTPVEAVSSQDMWKLGPQNTVCCIHVSRWGLTLVLQKHRSIVAQWPLKSIRQYESSGMGELTLEVGRRAPLGSGTYRFRCLAGADEAVCRTIDKVVAEAAKASQENLLLPSRTVPSSETEAMRQLEHLRSLATVDFSRPVLQETLIQAANNFDHPWDVDPAVLGTRLLIPRSTARQTPHAAENAYVSADDQLPADFPRYPPPPLPPRRGPALEYDEPSPVIVGTQVKLPTRSSVPAPGSGLKSSRSPTHRRTKTSPDDPYLLPAGALASMSRSTEAPYGPPEFRPVAKSQAGVHKNSPLSSRPHLVTQRAAEIVTLAAKGFGHSLEDLSDRMARQRPVHVRQSSVPLDETANKVALPKRAGTMGSPLVRGGNRGVGSRPAAASSQNSQAAALLGQVPPVGKAVNYASFKPEKPQPVEQSNYMDMSKLKVETAPVPVVSTLTVPESNYMDMKGVSSDLNRPGSGSRLSPSASETTTTSSSRTSAVTTSSAVGSREDLYFDMGSHGESDSQSDSVFPSPGSTSGKNPRSRVSDYRRLWAEQGRDGDRKLEEGGVAGLPPGASLDSRVPLPSGPRYMNFPTGDQYVGSNSTYIVSGQDSYAIAPSPNEVTSNSSVDRESNFLYGTHIIKDAVSPTSANSSMISSDTPKQMLPPPFPGVPRINAIVETPGSRFSTVSSDYADVDEIAMISDTELASRRVSATSTNPSPIKQVASLPPTLPQRPRPSLRHSHQMSLADKRQASNSCRDLTELDKEDMKDTNGNSARRQLQFSGKHTYQNSLPDPFAGLQPIGLGQGPIQLTPKTSAQPSVDSSRPKSENRKLHTPLCKSNSSPDVLDDVKHNRTSPQRDIKLNRSSPQRDIKLNRSSPQRDVKLNRSSPQRDALSQPEDRIVRQATAPSSLEGSAEVLQESGNEADNESTLPGRSSGRQGRRKSRGQNGTEDLERSSSLANALDGDSCEEAAAAPYKQASRSYSLDALGDLAVQLERDQYGSENEYELLPGCLDRSDSPPTLSPPELPDLDDLAAKVQSDRQFSTIPRSKDKKKKEKRDRSMERLSTKEATTKGLASPKLEGATSPSTSVPGIRFSADSKSYRKGKSQTMYFEPPARRTVYESNV